MYRYACCWRLLDTPVAYITRRAQVGLDLATAGGVTGVEADVTLAAYYAAEVAAKTIKAGNTNTQVGAFRRGSSALGQGKRADRSGFCCNAGRVSGGHDL